MLYEDSIFFWKCGEDPAFPEDTLGLDIYRLSSGNLPLDMLNRISTDHQLQLRNQGVDVITLPDLKTALEEHDFWNCIEGLTTLTVYDTIQPIDGEGQRIDMQPELASIMEHCAGLDDISRVNIDDDRQVMIAHGNDVVLDATVSGKHWLHAAIGEIVKAQHASLTKMRSKRAREDQEEPESQDERESLSNAAGRANDNLRAEQRNVSHASGVNGFISYIEQSKARAADLEEKKDEKRMRAKKKRNRQAKKS